MIKTALIICSVCCMALLAFVVIKHNNNKADSNGKDHLLQVESSAFQINSGWGYNILVDHKIFIHQDFIPSIEGKKYFSSKEDALKTASLVIDKILKTGHPALSQSDIAALKISY